MEKHPGTAPSYKPIKDTLELDLAQVVFNGRRVTFTKKQKGKLTNEQFKVRYKTAHGVTVVYGRLKNAKDKDFYLDTLLHKLQRQKEIEERRKLIKKMKPAAPVKKARKKTKK